MQHGLRTNDQRVHVRQDAAQDRAIHGPKGALARDVGVIGHHSGSVTAEQRLGHISDRVGMMEVCDIDVRATGRTQESERHGRRGKARHLAETLDYHAVGETLPRCAPSFGRNGPSGNVSPAA